MASTIKERSAQLKAYLDAAAELEALQHATVWAVFEAMDIDDSVPKDWFGSVSRFLTRIELAELINAARVALRAKPYSEKWRFKYFCGICWRLFNQESAS
jgi:hypothetical protein